MRSAQGAVVVVGAGIAGVACARELQAAGVEVRILDRGHQIGGRMASRRIDGRAVDLGAAYFTADDDDFAAVVDDWERRGLARPWTTRFTALDPDEPPHVVDGPTRWSAPGSLRSLVEDLAADLTVEKQAVECVERTAAGFTVDGVATAAVVLAMPDPQARQLLSGAGHEEAEARLDRAWEPVLALVASWPEVAWSTWGVDREFEGAFVNADPVLSFVADDGRRRGDGAPVLVAHSTPEFAARHLEDPDAAAPELTAALCARFDLPTPRQVLVKRWSLARPVGTRRETHLLTEAGLGVCGDGWGEPSRVQTAWLSGRALGRELGLRLNRS